jgi:quercetin 2,3-dioxygenase
MISIRHAEERGVANLGWLDSRHTFSFGHYYDAARMGFGPLRVINEDRVQPGRGFDSHGHRDMEIISYVLDGALGHEDSTGAGSVIRPGEIQCMSAGAGIRHSEFNVSKTEPVHFLQIWLIPEHQGLRPSYDQKAFADDERRGRLRLVASSDGNDGSVVIHLDAKIYVALLDSGDQVTHELTAERRAWLQVARGAVDVLGDQLLPGDGAAIEDVPSIRIVGGINGAEILLFDLP